MGSQLVWCSYCGRDIWIVTNQRIQLEDLICTECKRILDTYKGDIMEESTDWCSILDTYKGDENGTAKETQTNTDYS